MLPVLTTKEVRINKNESESRGFKIGSGQLKMTFKNDLNEWLYLNLVENEAY